jgi:hypothetical protein
VGHILAGGTIGATITVPWDGNRPQIGPIGQLKRSTVLEKKILERWIVNLSPDGNSERTLVDPTDVIDRLAATLDAVVLFSAAEESDSQLMRQMKQG